MEINTDESEPLKCIVKIKEIVKFGVDKFRFYYIYVIFNYLLFI